MTTKDLITACHREEIWTQDFSHMRQKCRAFDRDVSMASFCERGNKPSAFMKMRDSLDWLSGYWLWQEEFCSMEIVHSEHILMNTNS